MIVATEINFNELFFPVVCYEIACLCLAVFALKDWNIHNIDIKMAYLYNDLNKKIYIKQPEGFRLPYKEKKFW